MGIISFLLYALLIVLVVRILFAAIEGKLGEVKDFVVGLLLIVIWLVMNLVGDPPFPRHFRVWP